MACGPGARSEGVLVRLGSTVLAYEQDQSTASSASLERFTRELERYLALRTRATTEVPPLAVTPNPAEIESGSNRLAAAIMRARGMVARGEFFGPPVDGEIRLRLAEVNKQMNLREISMPDDAEERSSGRVDVHARFPQGKLVSTMPPAVLAVLPPIPATLEYRFVGRTLILRDVEAALILDFLPNAIP
jgi:hypothetical protein